VPKNRMPALLLSSVILAGSLPAAMAQQAPSDPAPPPSLAAGATNDVTRARVNTIYGPAGLIAIPNAYTATQNRLVLGTFFGKDKSVSANYGLIRGVDVGATYVDRSSGNDRVLGNAKVNIVPGNFKHFELGLGVIDLADQIDQTFYVVVSGEWMKPGVLEKSGASGVRLHLGYGSGLFNGTAIGGGEVVFTRKFSALAEYDGHRVNGAVRYVHDQALRLQAGIYRSHLFFDACYGFSL
jgi:hypothetical protein